MKKKIVLILTICLMVLINFSMSVSSVSATDANSSGLTPPKILSVARKGTGKTTITWKKMENSSGYEIQYGTKKNFSDATIVNIKKETTTSRKISSFSTSKNSYIRMRAYKKWSDKTLYSNWSAPVKLIVWHKSWKYAKNSKIHSDPAVLYYSEASKSKNITVAVNAGHGTKGGSSKQTLCHPDGSLKVTGGSTASGAKYATAISEGTRLKNLSEAEANLKIANKLKAKLLKNGYNVLMIRQDSNTQLDNIARTLMANNNADCHISIHFDSTTSDKGAFYISVPNISSYRNMEPVKSNWKKHNRLGTKMISGLRKNDVKIWASKSMALDLTQTSYSTIPSVDVEVGDRKTSTSNKNLNKIADGLLSGVNIYFSN